MAIALCLDARLKVWALLALVRGVYNSLSMRLDNQAPTLPHTLQDLRIWGFPLPDSALIHAVYVWIAGC